MESSLNGDRNHLAFYPMKTLRVHSGDNIIVRTLSPLYFGFLTHWCKKRSKLCFYKECPGEIHKCDMAWKGYASVEQWFPGNAAWFPASLEITESLELDMRDLYARGQVWEIWKTLSDRGESEPVRGKMHESHPEETLPAEYDVFPVIRALYHVVDLPPRVKSHVPQRILVAPSPGPKPEVLNKTVAENSMHSFKDEFERLQQLKKQNERIESPAEKKKKQGY